MSTEAPEHFDRLEAIYRIYRGLLDLIRTLDDENPRHLLVQDDLLNAADHVAAARDHLPA